MLDFRRVDEGRSVPRFRARMTGSERDPAHPWSPANDVMPLRPGDPVVPELLHGSELPPEELTDVHSLRLCTCSRRLPAAECCCAGRNG